MNSRSGRGGQPGLTLVELLVVMSIIGIIMVFGIPSFEALIANNARTATVSGLIGHLQLARSEAVKRATDVTVCASTSAGTCDGGAAEWGNGYMVVVGTATLGYTDVIRRVGGAGRILIDGGGRRTIAYKADGTSPGANLTLVVCDSGGVAQSRAVVVSNVGRPTVRSATADDLNGTVCE
jgi:type IV fimbrial biogenesis protein FimT